MCLCSFMAAEFDDLPEAVKKEVQTFADVNVAWLSRVLSAAAVVSPEESEPRARAIFSAVAGAQLVAGSRGRSADRNSAPRTWRLPARVVQFRRHCGVARSCRRIWSMDVR